MEREFLCVCKRADRKAKHKHPLNQQLIRSNSRAHQPSSPKHPDNHLNAGDITWCDIPAKFKPKSKQILIYFMEKNPEK